MASAEQKKTNTIVVKGSGPVTPVAVPVETSAGVTPLMTGSSSGNVRISAATDPRHHSVQVLPAAPVATAGEASASGGLHTIHNLLPTATLKHVTLLKTQQPSSREMKTFESLSEHIDVFLVEVYRCKLCKFHSAVKAVISQHMTEKHFPEPGISKETAANQAQSRSDQGLETIVIRNEQCTCNSSETIAPAASSSANQHMVLPSQTLTSSYSALSCTTDVVATVTAQVPAFNPMVSTPQVMASNEAASGAPVQVQITSQASPASLERNALELLMGIGNENDPDTLKSKQTVTSSQVHAPLGSGVEMGSVPIPEVPNSEACELKQETGLASTIKMGGSKAGGLLTVNEEELAETLRIDEKDSEEDSGDDGDDRDDDEEEEDDDGDAKGEGQDLSGDNVRHSIHEGLNGEEALLKPIPIQIGLTPATNIDIQEIANTASLSNPKATTITVLHHGQGNGPPTAIQFKKSKKSEAVIPTGESLGITSPFTSRAYKGNKLFVCNTCNARYKSRDELDRHVKKQHQRTKKFLCEICGIALATRASVKYHVSKKHEEVRLMHNCSFCDYCTPFAARMAIHKATHQSKFSCNLCKKSYVSAKRLTRHLSSPLHKNALNPLVCEHCGYSTKKKDNFLVHMRKHTGEKPYKCKVCGFASADGSTLKKHVMAKHSTIRPFKCKVCNFSCVDKKALDIHSRKHTGERPFKCQYCTYAAKRPYALKIHMQSHSREGSADKQAKVVPRLREEIVSGTEAKPMQAAWQNV